MQRLACRISHPPCHRKGFGHVVRVNQQLISILEEKGGAAVDMDNASLRVTLDVIGRVGFGKDFGATRDLSDGRANLAFDMMEAGEKAYFELDLSYNHRNLKSLRTHMQGATRASSASTTPCGGTCSSCQ